MMISYEEIKRLVMSFMYQERKKVELKHYREEIRHLQNMEKDELNLEYINVKTEYEHKKNIIFIFLLSIVLSVLMDIWKIFYGFIENLFSYYVVPKPDEIEIVQVSFAIFAILIAFISCIILGILIFYIRRMRQIYRSLLIMEELRYIRKKEFNPNRLKMGKSDCGISTFQSNDKEAIKIAWNEDEFKKGKNMGYMPKIIKGIVHDTGLPIDGCTLALSLWSWDNQESYHLYVWDEDDDDDEAVMMTMHKEDMVFCDMPIEEFKELWKVGEYEMDGVYCIPFDKVNVLEVICEEQEN